MRVQGRLRENVWMGRMYIGKSGGGEWKMKGKIKRGRRLRWRVSRGMKERGKGTRTVEEVGGGRIETRNARVEQERGEKR